MHESVSFIESTPTRPRFPLPHPTLHVTTLDKVQLVQHFQVGRLAVVALKKNDRDSKAPPFFKLASDPLYLLPGVAEGGRKER